MSKTAALLIAAALVSGLFAGALIGRKDLDYWQDRAAKNDLAFKALSFDYGDLRKRYEYNLKASLRNQETDAKNKRNFDTAVDENGKLREGLRLALERNNKLSEGLRQAIDRGMEAERNAMLWRNKCGGAK